MRSRCKYEGVKWESIWWKYERIQQITVESYPKTNEESKDFPILKNCNFLSYQETYSLLVRCCVHISKIVKKITSLQISFRYAPLGRA